MYPRLHTVCSTRRCVYVYVYADFHRSNNFIVGLTNRSRTGPVSLGDYILCGQYPGAVPRAATVTLYCAADLPPARYVIVQFPMTGQMNFCELQVFAFGLRLSSIHLS